MMHQILSESQLQGQVTAPIAAYKDFLTLWTEADPDIPA